MPGLYNDNAPVVFSANSQSSNVLLQISQMRVCLVWSADSCGEIHHEGKLQLLLLFLRRPSGQVRVVWEFFNI